MAKRKAKDYEVTVAELTEENGRGDMILSVRKTFNKAQLEQFNRLIVSGDLGIQIIGTSKQK